MKASKIIYIVILFIGTTVCGQIQVHPTLKKAIEKAITKSKELQNKKLDNKKDELHRKGVKNKYLPKLEFSGAYAYSMGTVNIDVPARVLPLPLPVPIPLPLPPGLKQLPLFGGESSFETSAQVFHTSIMAKSILFSGFQIPNIKKALQKKIEGNSYLIEASKEEIVKDVVHSFDQLILLREAKKIIENSEKRLVKEKLRVDKAISLGLAIPYDSDKIELAKLELYSKRLTVNGSEQVLIAKLSYLTDLTAYEINEMVFELNPAFQLNKNLDISNRKEIKALEVFKEAKEYMIKKEKGNYYPKVGLFMGVNYSGVFNSEIITPVLPISKKQLDLKLDKLIMQPMFMAGVGLKWTLFDGLEREHKIEMAEIGKLQLENKLSDTKQKLNLLLKNTTQKFETENSKLSVTYQQEKIATHNLKTARKQFKLGLMNITERLAAENEFLKAKMNTVQSLVNQRLAGINMFMASGDLSKKIQTK